MAILSPSVCERALPFSEGASATKRRGPRHPFFSFFSGWGAQGETRFRPATRETVPMLSANYSKYFTTLVSGNAELFKNRLAPFQQACNLCTFIFCTMSVPGKTLDTCKPKKYPFLSQNAEESFLKPNKENGYVLYVS